MIQTVQGIGIYKYAELHDKYGPVVRVAPNELSFITPQTWPDVYGSRPGKGQMPKSKEIQPAEGFEVANMIVTDIATHSRFRRVISHAFSDKAMREQEPLITEYVDKLMARLHENAGKPVDLAAWFNFTAFDVIGDLAFGESFNCLRDGKMHPWITFMFQNLKLFVYSNVAGKIPFLKSLLMKLAPQKTIDEGMAHAELVKQQVSKRIEQGETKRPDFITYILRHGDKATRLTVPEIQTNAYVIIIGGSETTATLLAGAVYYLSQNSHTMERLKAEIREKFKTEDEIRFSAVSSLPYLTAVLTEAMRVYPPISVGLPREVPPGGDIVDGYAVPGGTSVGVCQWAAYHSASNFTDPDSFVPSRWLDEDPRYDHDKKDVLQPFSYGPRNCVGKNLAYMEMRTILARLVWNFDIELLPESQNWTKKQRVFFVWEKGPLMVKLTRASR
ncbi:cytochrome P450 [Microthyrium microscopicum]|uniref:Cytochrome P450 n=1 Tax=Microthyrium microscopicum TaxID=703497 RepID=A0A6A6U7Q6_9PEZI|nr:cytochrome P450 [Microthyrium microscopicum]